MTCPRCQARERGGREVLRGVRRAARRWPAPSAARALPPGAKFCPECAHPAGSPPRRPAAQRFDSPESYTPSTSPRRSSPRRAALEGERKQVTVLFADLKGSMELLADRDPEEARKLLDPVLERMMEAVHRYEGTVNQVMGDGIMALFGAPLAHEDHAVRACYAALGCRRRSAVRGGASGARTGCTSRSASGLNSGEVVVRAIGSDLRMDYTAVGPDDPPRRPHGADGRARARSSLTADTLRAGRGLRGGHARSGRCRSRGCRTPVRGVRAGRGRPRALAAPGRGRARADALRRPRRASSSSSARPSSARAAATARSSPSSASPVSASRGSSGSSRTRIAPRVARRSRAGSVSYGKATPYLPVIDLLKAYFQIEDRDDPRTIREKVTGKLLALDRALEPALPALLALLDVAGRGPQWEALDPPAAPAADARRASSGCCSARARSSRSWCVFEDLHWIDAETQALLDGLVESLPTARLLLLVNYRPEYQHALGRARPTTASSGSTRCRPRAPRSCSTALLGADRGARAAQAAPDRADRGQPVLPRGERPDPRRDRSAGRRARAPTA